MSGLYLTIGLIFSLYIMFRVVWCLVMYTKAYLTVQEIYMLDFYVIGNMKIVHSDMTNWFFTAFGTIFLYSILALFTVVIWPVIMIMCLNTFLENKRKSIVGE